MGGSMMKYFTRYGTMIRFVGSIVAVCIQSHTVGWGHTVWQQRNESGPWTVCLYHCDEEITDESLFIYNAIDDPDLHVSIGPAVADPLTSTTDVRHGFLNRAIVGRSEQSCISQGKISHPMGDLSIEFWMKFIEYGADIQIGFQTGVSLRIRIGGEGDRFQLVGANEIIQDSTQYSAPGFESFPPVGNWHHYGVTIHAPSIRQNESGTFSYEEGSYAQFFYDSHIVGFVDQTKLDLTGLEFSPQSNIMIQIHHGTMIFDEIMISNIDWSNPVGHGGAGHGGIRIGHAFENGRQPVSISDWCLF